MPDEVSMKDLPHRSPQYSIIGPAATKQLAAQLVLQLGLGWLLVGVRLGRVLDGCFKQKPIRNLSAELD